MKYIRLLATRQNSEFERLENVFNHYRELCEPDEINIKLATETRQLEVDVDQVRRRVKSEIGQMDSKIGQMNTEIGEMKTEIGRVGTEIGQRYTEIDQGTVETGQRNTEMNNKLDVMETEFGKTEEHPSPAG
jgi:hypothetical protein